MADVKPPIIDDKSPHCIPFILSLLSTHASKHPSRPFIIGLNGVQGAGKTTLVSTLANTLSTTYQTPTLVFSIDDLYLPHKEQTALAQSHPLNPLVQHRGEPGTHDVKLGASLFRALLAEDECRVPRYDKSAFDGSGDRVSESEWRTVNASGMPKIKVVIFEGWCVGFRAIPKSSVSKKQEASRALAEKQEGQLPSQHATPKTTLYQHRLEDLLFVNQHLSRYDVMTDEFDAMIHIDAQDTEFVYAWRLEQEEALRRERGSGMTDEQVMRFVDGYYPAYELFTEQLREGVFRHKGDEGTGKQLRLVVGRDRKVVEVVKI